MARNERPREPQNRGLGCSSFPDEHAASGRAGSSAAANEAGVASQCDHPTAEAI
jgi:hypothetical protein